ncbi:MAG: DUF433 domain-containing protein [Phycisphaerales bacterium]|nr:DUF433 domain-containing protein [Phycisphaerales bacterium]
MEASDLLTRIQIDPAVCGGKPCVRGTRIWVTLILDLLAGGMSQEELLREYPQLQAVDVRACIAYAAEMSRERFIDVSKGSACA